MEKDIINLEQYADALRRTGYKNIESAVSEIVDNSLEANATDVLIIVNNKVSQSTGRKWVNEILFLDNGHGMNKDLVQSCLRIGYGTRRDKKGMGRFGVGLPQASMHVAPLVEVYSWENGLDTCYKSFLDINKLKDGTQKKLKEPEKEQIPEDYTEYLELYFNGREIDFKKSGTLVIWKNCDNVSPKTVIPLFDRLEFALGQKFRYWMKDNTKNIYLINHENHNDNRIIIPNDPLMLMERNIVLGNPEYPKELRRGDNSFNAPIFEPFTNECNTTGVVDFPVQYFVKSTGEMKESIVKLKFSVVKKEYYDQNAIPSSFNPGSFPIGKHVKKIEGISIVRANREIDFGKFDFYSNLNEPEHRWWGCEISFQPDLDEAFGVSNNKQHVELIELRDEEFEDDEIKPIWIQLKTIITETIKSMVNRNKQIRIASRASRSIQKPSEEIINESEENNTTTESEEIRKTKKIDEVRKEAINTLREQGIENPTNEEINQLLLNKVNIVYVNNGNAPFFDYSTSLGICKCVININHIFYKKFMTHIEHNPQAKVAFELFLASLIRSRDEITDDNMKTSYNNVIDDWNYKLSKYIRNLDL